MKVGPLLSLVVVHSRTC